MGGKLNIAVLRLLAEHAFNIKRLGYAVFERRGKVIVGHTVRFFNALPLALTRYGVGFKVRALPLDNIGNVNAESQCAAVNKGKV